MSRGQTSKWQSILLPKAHAAWMFSCQYILYIFVLLSNCNCFLCLCCFRMKIVWVFLLFSLFKLTSMFVTYISNLVAVIAHRFVHKSRLIMAVCLLLNAHSFHGNKGRSDGLKQIWHKLDLVANCDFRGL